jgi:hypothetical protein
VTTNPFKQPTIKLITYGAALSARNAKISKIKVVLLDPLLGGNCIIFSLYFHKGRDWCYSLSSYEREGSKE